MITTVNPFGKTNWCASNIAARVGPDKPSARATSKDSLSPRHSDHIVNGPPAGGNDLEEPPEPGTRLVGRPLEGRCAGVTRFCRRGRVRARDCLRQAQPRRFLGRIDRIGGRESLRPLPENEAIDETPDR